MSDSSVVSLAERLKHRRAELGISQAQAARELDVARTAYRLWELEAAKPAPDRWRLIASWLGVSVTTMLLAEDLVTSEEASMSAASAFDFGLMGRPSDVVATKSDFFAQARALVADGARSGVITSEHAQALGFVVERIEQETRQMETEEWEAGELRKTLAAAPDAPAVAREAISFVGEDLPDPMLQTARLLASELVTNSVRHGPTGTQSTIGLFVGVGRNRIRVEVSDGSPNRPWPRTPSENGGYGLAFVAALASRWGTGREGDRNVTWFELDLPHPGASPSFV